MNKQDADYHKEYRRQRAVRYKEQMNMMDGKLDKILGAIAEQILEHKKIMDVLTNPMRRISPPAYEAAITAEEQVGRIAVGEGQDLRSGTP